MNQGVRLIRNPQLETAAYIESKVIVFNYYLWVQLPLASGRTKLFARGHMVTYTQESTRSGSRWGLSAHEWVGRALLVCQRFRL
jgi:hypothetical protein